MRTLTLAVIAALAVGGSASAAERAPHIPLPSCHPIAEMKAEPSLRGITFSPLTVGQFHFIQGVYAASPFTPSGPPPGEGALLFQIKGKSHIIWTHGKDVCMSIIVVGQAAPGVPPKGAYLPMPISEDIAKALTAIKTGKDEIGAPDYSGDERSL